MIDRGRDGKNSEQRRGHKVLEQPGPARGTEAGAGLSRAGQARPGQARRRHGERGCVMTSGGERWPEVEKTDPSAAPRGPANNARAPAHRHRITEQRESVYRRGKCRTARERL